MQGMLTKRQVLDKLEEAITINRKAAADALTWEDQQDREKRIKQLNDQWVKLEEAKHDLLGTDFAPYRMVR